MRTLLIDNYDSFTMNLFHILAEVNGESPHLVRNDEYSWATLRSKFDFDNIVISPGPGRPDRPEDFGVCAEALTSATVPILGVCLGHQGLAHAFGGAVIHAPNPMHGRLSAIYHDGAGLFSGCKQGFSAVRYHSLIVTLGGSKLRKTAWTSDGLIMGIAHTERPHFGVQFHPESICSEYGSQILANFRDTTHKLAGRRQIQAPARSTPSERPLPHPESEYHLIWRRLNIFPDSAAAFDALFKACPSAFWLDSSRVIPGLSRFSYMGANLGPEGLVLRYSRRDSRLEIESTSGTSVLSQSIFDFLESKLAQTRIASANLPFDFWGGFVGYLGYELKAETGAEAPYFSSLPDAAMIFADRLVAFDHATRECYLVAIAKQDNVRAAQHWIEHTSSTLRVLQPLAQDEPVPVFESVTFALDQPYPAYMQAIQQCLEHLRNGESYELCLTNELSGRVNVDPYVLYRRLRTVNPAPFSSYLKFDGVAVLSSSPERFLRCDADGQLESKPIKGTRPRGRTPEEDARFVASLETDEKDRSEHLMIVDLVRNDLGRVSEVGSVKVPRLMHVETYQTVHQLVSNITGKLKAGCSAIDAVRAAFPAGSMTGAPKLRTMKLLDQLENRARGIYSGAIGYFSASGASDLSVVIRTMVITGDTIRIGAGGAIVALSDADAEFDEMLLKAAALMTAVRTVQNSACAMDTETLKCALKERACVTL